MLKAMWYAVKVGLLVAACVWIANRPGDISIRWMDYTIDARAWFLMVSGLLALLAVLAVHRLYLGILGFTGAVRRYREWRRHKKGQRALLLGLAAVAAGDRKLADYQASRARHYMPKDRGLTLLLEGDAALLKGDAVRANQAYESLLQNKDGAFLGMRGLLGAALSRGNGDEALKLARRAIAMHPKQAWLQRLAYKLEVQERHWDAALRSLRRIEKTRIMTREAVIADRQAILLLQAQDYFENAQDKAGAEKLKSAYRLDPSFVPAATALAVHYIEAGQKRAAVKLVAKSWSLSPHPELADLWADLAPVAKNGDTGQRMRWFERLVALRPDSDESQLAAAGAAIDERLWGEARQYLSMAESIRASARLYHLRATMEEQLSHPNEARHWHEKALQADADPVWTCRDTGQVFERWSPLAEPHGGFNTIHWGFPAAGRKTARIDAGSIEPDMTLLPRLRA